MSNIRTINPSRKRYRDNAVAMLKKSVGCIEALDNKVAGYLLLAWDDRGGTVASVKTGGPVSTDLLPLHCYPRRQVSDRGQVKFTLPFPPSVNGLYGGGSGQQRFKSAAYKKWLLKCPELPKLALTGPLEIKYTFAWPDKRKRDGQSYFKAVTDYLVNEGVITDDNWLVVDRESWCHIGVEPHNPRVEIDIAQIEQ